MSTSYQLLPHKDCYMYLVIVCTVHLNKNIFLALSEDHKMQAKKLYDEAMKKGYAECSTIKCLVHGSAGVGKTHLKHLLLKMPPPKQRISTGIADNPVRVVTISAVGMFKQDEDDWQVLDGDYDLMRAVSLMIKGYVDPLPKGGHRMIRPVNQACDPTLSNPTKDGYYHDPCYTDQVHVKPPTTCDLTYDVSGLHRHTHTHDEVNLPLCVPSVPGPVQPDITSSHMSVEESSTVTISDEYSHIAVHIIVHCDCMAPHSTVRSWLHQGIIAACTHLGYLESADNEIIDAMYCMCGYGDRHYADIGVTQQSSWATCCHNETQIMQLSKDQPFWFSTVSIPYKVPTPCQNDGKLGFGLFN